MSKTKESLLGYASVPVIVALVMMGFMLIISTVFMGIPDLAGVEVHPLILFPVFVIAVLVWGLGVLCSLNYVICGSFGLGSEDPKIRFTLLGAARRMLVATAGWLVVLASLSLIPATRSVMIQPLAFVGRPAIPLIVRFLHDRNPRVRRSAIDVLRYIGPPAKSAAPEIVPFLNDPDDQVRYSASAALQTLDPSLRP